MEIIIIEQHRTIANTIYKNGILYKSSNSENNFNL